MKRALPLIRLLRYLKPYKKEYLLGTTYSLLNTALDIAPEILIGVAVNCVVKQQSSWLAAMGVVSLKAQLLLLGLLTLLIWGFESLTQYLYSIKWRNLAQILQHKLRLDCCGHVQKLDLSVFEKQNTGSLLSILNDDVNQLERLFETDLNKIIHVFASTLFVGLIFFILSPSLGVLAILPIPLVLLGSFFFQHKLAPLFMKVREKAGAIGRTLNNNISGIATIKTFTAETHALKELEEASDAYRKANREAIRWSSMVTPIIRIAILMGFVGTLVYGGFLTINGEISIGVYSILVFLTQRLLWPLTQLAEITVNYQRAMASATRVLDLLEKPVFSSSEGDPLPKEGVEGKISFENVSFAYEPNRPILHKINFTIAPKETVAFVGTTGSGKTTLIKQLLRFYQTSEGKITIDGKGISTVRLDDLRQTMGYVTQDVFLFDATIAENIAYGRPNTSEEEIIEAAKLAEAHTFIEKLPQQYASLVGERGIKLSGGQRQRIALARALLCDPPILILDEATSSVDNETERAIQRSLKHIIGKRTTIMIAHRLSTVRLAKRIFVLEEGKIVEQGSHEELLTKGGIYANLWKIQKGA